MAYEQRNFTVVVAVDFGTSRSGYAYAWTGASEREVYSRTNWPGQPTQALYPKTLTVSLYHQQGELAAWGYEARQQLSERKIGTGSESFSYFERFKMELWEGRKRGEAEPTATPSESQGTPERLPVLTLITDYLRKIKDLALEEINSSTRGHLRHNEILWCLTVPAIWGDAEKQLMRRAAQHAGLITDDPADAERLVLVLEPETAAIYCQQKEKFELERGTRFMVVDCGGGTVDITTYEVGQDKGLRETAPGTGGPYGATYVDQEFLKYLEHKVSMPALRRFREEYPHEYLKMMIRWEDIKCGFDPRKTEHVTHFDLPVQLYNRILLPDHPEVLEQLADAQEGDDAVIHLSYATMVALFTPVLDGIIQEVNHALDRQGTRSCDYMFLVGGFSESNYLRQRVDEVFHNRVTKIIMPPNPGAAIVEGAVSYGLNPSIIRARRSRLTYGCDMSSPFVDGVDRKSKRFWHDERNEWYCTDRLAIFVVTGDLVEVGEHVDQPFLAGSAAQQIAQFKLYATRKRHVRYIDEPGVEQIGEMELQMPGQGLDRRIIVTMQFGETEIKVEAHDLTSGNRCESTLTFKSVYFPELLED
jgi:hypothetical protein